jgi:hypothetical protein
MKKFFDLEDYKLKPEHLKTLKPGDGVGKPAPTARPKTISGIKRKDAFAIIPLWWAARANEAGSVNLMACVDLVYRAWRVRGSSKTFVMPNSKGVDRRAKIRTLCALERAGLITVEWRARKTPVVTLVVSIF